MDGPRDSLDVYQLESAMAGIVLKIGSRGSASSSYTHLRGDDPPQQEDLKDLVPVGHLIV
jgi:hypothetical protein